MKLLCYVLFSLLITLACTNSAPPTTVYNIYDKFNEEQLDSIFENFESIAYEQAESYINNPDSFFSTITAQAESSYQKEMYVYGLIFIAHSLLEHGKNFQSIKYYEKAYNYANAHSIAIANLNSEIIKPLANLYIRINDTQKSISLLRNTIESNKNENENIGLSNNLANAYLYNAQIDSAKSVLQHALEMPSNAISKALLHNSLATVYDEEKNYKLSLFHNTTAIENFKANKLVGDTLVWYISAIGLKGQLEQKTIVLENALSLAFSNFPQSQNRLKAKLTLIKADIEINQKNYRKSLQSYNQVLGYFTPNNAKYVLDYTYTQALIGKARLFTAENEIDSALYYYEWAIENDFRTQQLIVSSKDQLRNNILNKETIEGLVSLILNKAPLITDQRSIQQLLWCIELSKARLLINEINRSDQWSEASEVTKSGIQRIRNLYTQIDISTDEIEKKSLTEQVKQLMLEFQLSEKYFESARFEPNKKAFLNHLNNPNADFYSYFIHNDSSISIIHKSAKKYSFYRNNDATLLMRLMAFKEKYFSNSPNNYNLNPQAYQIEAKYLAEYFLPKIENAAGNIFLSLDGQLYGFPFDALYSNDFLVKKFNFAYLNSFLLFDLLSLEATDNTDITILYRSEYNPPLPKLAFVLKEVDYIKDKHSVNLIVPKNQNDSTLRQQFSLSNVIHIAAHTILDTLIAPVIYLNEVISTKRLRYHEIQAPLVFLSACNTGHGRALPSEGTESIQRVFLSKNVPSVVSTFWFANDETMLQITADFYHELGQSTDPIFALAQSKRNYLAHASPAQQNPWYWANINYTGVGNKIGLKKTPNLLYYFVGIITLFILVYFIVRVLLWFYKSIKNEYKVANNKVK